MVADASSTTLLCILSSFARNFPARERYLDGEFEREKERETIRYKVRERERETPGGTMERHWLAQKLVERWLVTIDKLPAFKGTLWKVYRV